MSQSPSTKRPASHEEYCIDCEHGMFVPDEEVNKKFIEMGLSQEQAQGVYDFRADREVEKLVNHYGGEANWKEMARQLLAFGSQNLPVDVLDSLSSSFEGVLALERMMGTNEPSLKTANAHSAGAGMAEKDLQSMMRDPKYWRDKDPAFVAKVTQGFQNMYGD